MSQTFSLQGSGFTRREALRTVVLTFGGTALPGALSFLSPGARAASPSPSASPTAAPMVSNSLGGKLSLTNGPGGKNATPGGGRSRDTNPKRLAEVPPTPPLENAKKRLPAA